MDLDKFFTRVNPLIGSILRSPFHWLLSPGLLLLTVTGRKTGRRYTIPVGYQRGDGDLTVMVSKARRKSWWRNYREPGPVELCLGGRTCQGTAELVPPGSPEFRRRCTQTLERMPWLGRQFGIEFDRNAGLDDAQLQHLGEENACVRITLESDRS